MSSVTEFSNLLLDTIVWDDDEKVLCSSLVEELEGPDQLLKFTEAGRRDRQRRLDAGDETVRIKFTNSVQPMIPKAAQPGQAWGGKAGGKGVTVGQVVQPYGKGKW